MVQDRAKNKQPGFQAKSLHNKRKGFFAFIKQGLSLRNITPKGLWARTILIVLIPVLILQSALGYSFLQNHWHQFTDRLTEDLVSDIALIVDLYEDKPTQENRDVLSELAFDKLNLNIDFLKKGQLPKITERPFFGLLNRKLSQELSAHMPHGFWFDTVGQSDFVEIRVALNDSILQVVAERSRAFADDSIWFLTNIAGFTIITVMLAILVLHNQVRPIVRLSTAMDAFGRGGQDSPFTPRGATEIRRAGLNFLRMKQRIQRFIDQRSYLLSGISHDLRTILTRLRLDLEMMKPDATVKRSIHEIEAMTDMLNAYLSFARAISQGENETGEISLTELVTGLEQHVAPEKFHLEISHVGMNDCKDIYVSISLKRVLLNILNNALRYADRAFLNIRRDEVRGLLLIALDDNGPGIPFSERERVFQPFYQSPDDGASDSNSPKTFGLGLAIARDLIQALGGQIDLADSPEGGLRVNVGLPVSPL